MPETFGMQADSSVKVQGWASRAPPNGGTNKPSLLCGRERVRWWGVKWNGEVCGQARRDERQQACRHKPGRGCEEGRPPLHPHTSQRVNSSQEFSECLYCSYGFIYRFRPLVTQTHFQLCVKTALVPRTRSFPSFLDSLCGTPVKKT